MRTYIPNTDPGYTTEAGVSFWRISPASALPTISQNYIYVDATTQTTNQGDTNPQGPEVEIDGSSAGNTDGFNVSGSHCTIEGFVINGFTGTYYSGIRLDGTYNEVRGNYLGTTATGEAN